MSGITSVLNIAKEALLAHQVSVQVAGHNVANVDTEGYTRQSLSLTPSQSVPSALGPIGNGVHADFVKRHYDQYATQRIMNQHSQLSNLDAQQSSLGIVETIFNEAPGLGLNDLLSQFWDSLQNLADNPELSTTRQSVVQQAELVIDQLHAMSEELIQARYDISSSLNGAISDANILTGQIAEINVKIISEETGIHKANDLRDQRDEMVKELSQLLDINYFETGSGAYTVLLPDGHSLVMDDTSSELDWSVGNLEWLSTRVVDGETQTIRTTVGSGAELGGKIGGWLEVNNLMKVGDPNNYAGRLESFANAFIRELNQQHSQGVGMTVFSEEVLGSETASNTAFFTGVVDAATAGETIAAGTFLINDRSIGKIDGAIATNGLATTKAYNTVKAINDAITGVTAKLTTQIAGSAVTALDASNHGDVFSFTINGVNVSYTADTDALPDSNSDGIPDVPDDTTAATFAQNVVAAINTAITAYNTDPTNPVDVNVEAVYGDGTNGGPLNSIVLRNTKTGDESQIIIGNITALPSGAEASLGLTAGTYNADVANNNGTISLFSIGVFSVEAIPDDTYLDHYGWGGGSAVTFLTNDTANDGEFTVKYEDSGIANSLQGFRYADQLITDNGSFDIWIYNTDTTLALAQPVTVALDGVYTLQDISNAINTSITNATNGQAWITASVSEDRLKLMPDDNHSFAFANDTSNLLQVAGINTLFTGYGTDTIGINEGIKANLDFMAAGTVSEYGEIFKGDNTNALLLSNIRGDENVSFIGTDSTSTLDSFYNGLVSDIGMNGRTISREYEYQTLVLNQMSELRDSTSGVSLDEEMANLIKFQQAFSAAAKFIGSADEMLRTLLDSVR
jgi:flagellar hook-associated protein 1 FlgK